MSAVPVRGTFRRDRANGKLTGVCAGLANRFGWDVTLTRTVFVIGTILGFGSFAVAYLAMAIIAD